MKKVQVAVIDVGSSQVTALVGERGINKTFVIKEESSYPYEGFGDGKFYDEKGFVDAFRSALVAIGGVVGKGESRLYIGVPSVFTKVEVKDSRISFPKKKKITEADVEALYDGAFVVSSNKYRLINRSPIVYELDDKRMVSYPIGQVSETLKGKLSFVFAEEYFVHLVTDCAIKMGFYNVECVSTTLAEALYLFDAETRDRIALMVDVGYITTSVSVISGDGILFEESFDYGGGYITASLSEKFDIEFEQAEKLKRKINLSTVNIDGVYEIIETEDTSRYNSEVVKATVNGSLDCLCERIALSLDKLKFVLPEYVPISVTGGGIVYIRGAKEYVSDRLNMAVKVVVPKVPLMDKPTESSKLSLLNLGLEQNGY